MNKGADDMSVHEEWISCSHWGMFPLERKPLELAPYENLGMRVSNQMSRDG